MVFEPHIVGKRVMDITGEDGEMVWSLGMGEDVENHIGSPWMSHPVFRIHGQGVTKPGENTLYHLNQFDPEDRGAGQEDYSFFTHELLLEFA